MIAHEALRAVVQLDHPAGDPDTRDRIRSRPDIGQRDNEAMRAGANLGVQ